MVGEDRTEHLFPTGQRQNMYFLSWTWATPKLTPVTRLEQTGADQGRDLLPLSIPRAAVRKTEHGTPAGGSELSPAGPGCLIRLLTLPRGLYQIKKSSPTFTSLSRARLFRLLLS